MGCRRGSGARGQMEVRGHIRGQRSQGGRGHGGVRGSRFGVSSWVLGVLWGAEGEVELGVSWRSEVTGGSEVMMGSEVSKGLILGSADGLLGALWGAEGGAGAWGQLGVRGHIRGQRSRSEQTPSWPHPTPLGPHRRHLGPQRCHFDPTDAILGPHRRHLDPNQTPSWPPKMPF